MALEKMDGRGAGLSSRQFESVLEAAETYREALVVRLCGAVGLRPAELARLTIGDIEQVRMDPPRYLVRVPGVDDREDRTAYLPTHVERELRRYARSNDLAAGDRIFPVTPRRLQMLVSEVGDRASDLFDEPALADISSSDLRQYFAARALVEHDINPRVVKAAGGWQSFEALESYLETPTDTTIVDAFAAVERPGPGGERGPGESPTEHVVGDSVIRLLLAASERYALVRLDAEATSNAGIAALRPSLGIEPVKSSARIFRRFTRTTRSKQAILTEPSRLHSRSPGPKSRLAAPQGRHSIPRDGGRLAASG